MQLHEARDAQHAYRLAAMHIAGSLAKCLVVRGRCVLGIVGGRTIPGLFDALCTQLEGTRAPQGDIHVVWLDERVHTDKNFTLTLPYLERLARIGLTISWHPFVSTTREGIAEEIAHCEEIIAGKLDIVILSSGEDGHICSLFPGDPTLKEERIGYMFVEHAPKPPPLRVSVTPPLLLTADEAFLFFVGEGKRSAFELFLSDGEARICPAKLTEAIEKTRVYTAL